MCGTRFSVGERVVCRVPGSWVDGLRGAVLALNVRSSDLIEGHAVGIDGHGWTVIPDFQLETDDAKAPGGV